MTITSLNVVDGTVGRKRLPFIQKKHWIVLGIVLAIILVIVILITTGALKKHPSEEVLKPPNPLKRLPPSASTLNVFDKLAVCSDNIACSQIGRDILSANGSAVDATVATMVCNGVLTMQSMGLGGGFFMTIYKQDEHKAYALNAREKAPYKVRVEMYKDDKFKSQNGPLAIAVPGELRGLWAAHQKFGKLPWKNLFQPTIDLCESGYIVTQHQSIHLGDNKRAQTDPNIKEWLINSDGSFKAPGSKVVPKKLCETLKTISLSDGNAFYNGTLSQVFLQDLKEAGSLIEKKDLVDYQPEWTEPISVTLQNGDSVFSAPPPASGILLGFIMKILDGYNFTADSLESPDKAILTYHRMVEAFKFAYAKRTELGDPHFIDLKQLISNLSSTQFAENIRRQIKDNSTSHDPAYYGAVFFSKPDHGTSHVSVLAPNGDAVSVTSSVNVYYGSGITSKNTGVILNSVMDDFSFPYFENFFGLQGSPNNEVKPGKRPLSSMAPSIVTDRSGAVRMVVGAAGGTRITSAIAQVIFRTSIFGQNIKEAVDAPRLHHQIFPDNTEYEYGLLQNEVDGLAHLGHKMKRIGALSVICGIVKNGSRITGNADHRKGGGVSGT